MSTEPIELPEVELGDGRTVISYEGGALYRVRYPNGEVQGFRPKVEATPENAVDDIVTAPPPPSVAAFVAAAVVAVQAMLDARAQQSGYDGILSAASYAADPTGAFAAEGAAFSAWRSNVWAACYAALNAHVPGTPLPAMETFLATLPAYVPPAP